MPRGISSTGLVCAVALLGGCSRGDGRMAVSGNITLDGKPLSLSVIRFEPVDQSGRGSGANIDGGQFQLDAKHGLQPGTYQVRIQAYRATGRQAFDPQLGKNIDETEQVRLRDIEPRQVTVAADAENVFSIALVSAAK